jgi:hypothetical protein
VGDGHRTPGPHVGSAPGSAPVVSGESRPTSRVADVLGLVLARADRSGWPTALVEDCNSALGAAGVGLAVGDSRGALAVVAATEGPGRAGEDLQSTLGEGPGRLASATGRVVHSPHLGSDARWAQYGREAAALGIGAAFSAPLQVGAVQLGVLDVYCRRPGHLSPDGLATLHAHAGAAVAVLLVLADGDDVTGSAADVAELVDVRPVVHQAAGMVAVQLDVPLRTALARLQGAAFASGRRLRDVAEDVVARRVRFDDTDLGMVGARVIERGRAARQDADGDRHQPDGGEDPDERRLG